MPTLLSLRGLSIASPLLAMTLLLPRIGLSQAAQPTEPSALQAAAAIEATVIDAIAKTEKSVVAISRQSGTLEETPDVITRGFVLDARTEALLKEIPGLVGSAIEGASVEERTDPGLIKEKIRVDLQRFFRKRSGLRPFVLPVVMEI